MLERAVPKSIQSLHWEWGYNATMWSWLHYGIGFTSAALGVVLAANRDGQIFTGQYRAIETAITGGLAAGLAFLVTALGANAKAHAYTMAERELGKAIVVYRNDPSTSETLLTHAAEKGHDILNAK